ncbi:MAG: serine/threonine protein kinase [Deltaproteobacteria bacterium]|nr:MAG: serine/threonine protein kinase [Deltaproteobacteria bacterium]TMQ16717.1 MAG: serine/threonine protein kinase [Deltaproteobacteria bacterium]
MANSIRSVASGEAPAYARDGLADTLNGKYVLDRQLGSGGMADVFLGRTIGAAGFSRPVAVKRVRDGLSRDPQFADLFVQEAQLSARLQHPNVVPVLDFDRDAEGRLFLVMELVDGVDLRSLIDTGGPLPLSVVIHLMIEILRGLDYAHELPINPDGVRGLIHRDMSPQNVLLSWEGAVKVSDFGIAKARAATRASGSVVIKGKPLYLSPEQINGWPLDGRSDLWAVGVMMFEMLCSAHPFAGGNVDETLGYVLCREIPSVRELRPDVPEDLSEVVASLLTRSIDHRMRSAEAAIAALVTCQNCPKAGREELVETLAQRFAGRAPVRARDISYVSPSDPTFIVQRAPVSVVHRKTSTSNLAGPSRRDRRWVWAVLAAFLVVGAAVAVLLAVNPKPSEVSKPATHEAAPSASPKSAASDLDERASRDPTLKASEGSVTATQQLGTPPVTATNGAASVPAPPIPAPIHDQPRAQTRRPPVSQPKSSGIHEIPLDTTGP